MKEKLIVGLVQEKYEMSQLCQKARQCSKNGVAWSQGYGSRLEGARSGQIWSKSNIEINKTVTLNKIGNHESMLK